jgi:hypothetical protein
MDIGRAKKFEEASELAEAAGQVAALGLGGRELPGFLVRRLCLGGTAGPAEQVGPGAGSRW